MTAFALFSVFFLSVLQSSDAASLESLKSLGEFTVTIEGEPYSEFAAGYKEDGRWAERIATSHSGKPVAILTPRGRLEARFAMLRLYLAVATSQRYTRQETASAPELIRDELEKDGRPVVVEEIVMQAGRTYYAKVETVSYMLPPERAGAPPSRHTNLVLAISDLPFKNGRPQRPLTPAFEGITY